MEIDLDLSSRLVTTALVLDVKGMLDFVTVKLVRTGEGRLRIDLHALEMTSFWSAGFGFVDRVVSDSSSTVCSVVDSISCCMSCRCYSIACLVLNFLGGSFGSSFCGSI